MDNPIRRIESLASTALQVIEGHRFFHLVTVIVHGKAMPCTPNLLNYVIPGIYLKGIASYHCQLFSSRMSNAQIFGQISDQNALFLMERGAVSRIIFVVFLLVDSLGLERTRKWFVTDIKYLKMRKAEYWSKNDSIGE